MTEIARYQAPPNPAALTFESVPQALELASKIAGTEFVPKDLRGKPEAVLACMLTGAELGLAPMSALSKIYVVDGRPTIAAELMRALVLRAGHDLWIETTTNKAATLGGRRYGSEHTTRITWTMDDAETAGLSRKSNWRNYPRAMLVARATGELCRFLFADVLAGISYTREEALDGLELEEETEAISNPDANLGNRPEGVADPEPPKTTRTAAKTTKAKTEKAPPEPPPEAAPPPLPGEAGLPPTTVADEDDGLEAGTVAPEPEGEKHYTPAQALAIRAREIGLSEDERRGSYLAVTEGRASSGKDLDREELEAVFGLFDRLAEQTVELEVDESGRWTVTVLESEALLFDSGPGKSPIVDPDDVPSFLEPPPHESRSKALDVESSEVPPEPENAQEAAGGPESEQSDAIPGSEAEWKTFLRSNGSKVADAIRAAAAFAGDPKAAPTGLAALAENRELSAKVAAYIVAEEG